MLAASSQKASAVGIWVASGVIWAGYVAVLSRESRVSCRRCRITRGRHWFLEGFLRVLKRPVWLCVGFHLNGFVWMYAGFGNESHFIYIIDE